MQQSLAIGGGDLIS